MTALKKLLAATFLVLLICAPNVSAKIVTDKVPLLTFADVPVAFYDAPNGKNKGSIPAEISLVLVKEIRSDSWAYGSYKSQSSPKRIYGWFKMTELQGDENFENYTDQLFSDTDVSRTRTSYSYNGNAPCNEDVIVVAKRGSKSKIIFKAEGIYYRMGWVENASLKINSESNYENYDDSYYDEPANEQGETIIPIMPQG